MKDKFAKLGSYSLEQTQVLNSNTPLIMIRKDDIPQLTIENPRDTKLRKDKLVNLLSQNVTSAMFVKDHSSL